MIDTTSLSPNWIKVISTKNRKADPALVEKVIRALLLLEGLVESMTNDFSSSFFSQSTFA